MSKQMNAGDIGKMDAYEDENGEIFLSVNDLVHHLENNKHRMNEIVPEHVTADRFIHLLRTFEEASKDL